MTAATPQRLRLTREMRIKQNRDFSRVRQEGQRLVVGCMIANWVRSPAGATARVGVVVGRRVGNSVARSRARRLLREAFRVHQHDLAGPVDLVLVARPSIGRKKFADVEHDFLMTMHKAGLLKLSA